MKTYRFIGFCIAGFLLTCNLHATQLTISGSINEKTENGKYIVATLIPDTTEYFEMTQNVADWTIFNLPDGVQLDSVHRVDDTHVRLYLKGNRTVDYDSDISIYVEAQETAIHNFYPDPLNSDTVDIFNANNDSESITLYGSAVEAHEDTAHILLTIHGGTFHLPLDLANFTLSNMPAGVGKSSVSAVNDSTVSISLTGTRTTDYDVSFSPTVTLLTAGYDDHTGNSNLSASSGFTFVAVIESASVSVSGDASITESNQSGKYLHITLQQDTFVMAAIDTSNIYLTGQPQGVKVGGVSYVDKNHVDVLLSGNSYIDYDAGIISTVHVKAAALQEYSSGEITANYTFTAVNDAESISLHWSYSPGTNGAEATLNNDAIIAVISGGTFNQSGVNTTNVTLTGGTAAGITMESVNYLSTDSIIINLAYDGTDFDSNIPLTVTVKNAAYDDHVNGGGDRSSSIQAQALNDPESISLSWAPGQSGLEANMNGAIVRVTISGGTWVPANINTTNITIDNTCNAYLTGGVTSITSIDNITQKTFDAHLYWDGTDYDSTRVLTIKAATASYKDAAGGSALSGKLVLQGTPDPAVVNVSWGSQPGPYGYEATLDTAVLHVTLTGATLITSALDAGVTIGGNAASIGVTRASTLRNKTSHSFDIDLNWNGTDFDTDKSIQVNIPSNAYRESSGTATGSITVPATVETVTLSGTILSGKNQQTDIWAGGSTIVLTLYGASWVAADADATHFKSTTINTLFDGFQYVSGTNSVSTIINALKGATSGTTNTALVRTSSTVLTITLPAIPNYDIYVDSRFNINVPYSLFTSKGSILATPDITIKVSAPTTATMFGGGNICDDGVSYALITTVITGKPPYTLYLSRNGAHYKTITGITGNSYIDTTQLEGSYGVDSLKDANFTIPYGSPRLSSTASVTKLPLPTVYLSPSQYTFKYDTSHYDMSDWGTPTGGIFSGPGVAKISGKYYFYPFFAGLGNDTIFYQAFNANGCSRTVSAVIQVIQSSGQLTFSPARANNTYCYNNSPFTVLCTDTAEFSIWPDQPGALVKTSPFSASIDPSKMVPDEYVLYYAFLYKGLWWFEKIQFTIEAPEKLAFKDAFPGTGMCRIDTVYHISGTPKNGVFQGTGIGGDTIVGFSFNPGLISAGLPKSSSVKFTYTSTNGCVTKDSTQLDIWDVPRPDFSLSDICVTEGDTLEKTYFYNKTLKDNLVDKWKWYFDDGAASLADNYSALKDASHHYLSIGQSIVKLTVVSKPEYNSCVVSKDSVLNFGKKPTANFSWMNECEKDITEFRNNSVSLSLNTDTFHWSFYNYDGISHTDTTTFGIISPGVGMPPNPRIYNKVGATYRISLMEVTKYGCSDTISKSFVLRPAISLTDDGYSLSFKDGRNGWESESETPINSWMFGTPPAPRFDYSVIGDSCWYTLITNKKLPEHSYITSPCYNFNNIDKPMVSMDVFRSFSTTNSDGAVLQYSTDNGGTWQNVSTRNEGVQWFNSYQISDGPGGSSIGWSGLTDAQWTESKTWLPDSLRGNVRFRIGYSNDGKGYALDGMAFDNIRIASRKRKVLLEHFTSIADNASTRSNALVNEVLKAHLQDAIAIEYHLNLTGEDPFYSFNPDDPSGRLLYYGIFRVPYMFGDGGDSIPGSSSPMVYDFYLAPKDPAAETLGTDIRMRSLEEPGFDIRIFKSWNGSTLNTYARIKALKDLPNGKINLQTAIVEARVRSNDDTVYFVMRKMLPDAAGLVFNQAWKAGDSVITAPLSWNKPGYTNSANLRIIMFMQDATTREVYQAAVDSVDLAMPTGITNNTDNRDKDFTLYPNPASDYLWIMMDQALKESMTFTVCNMLGEPVKTIVVEPLEKLKQISIGDLKPGIYLVKSSIPGYAVKRFVVNR